MNPVFSKISILRIMQILFFVDSGVVGDDSVFSV